MPNKVSVYQINLQNWVIFLYTNNKHSEKEIMETFPIIIIFFKNLRINLTKVVKAFYSEIFKSLKKKEIEEDTRS